VVLVGGMWRRGEVGGGWWMGRWGGVWVWVWTMYDILYCFVLYYLAKADVRRFELHA